MRWVRRIAVGLLVLVLVAVGIVFGGSEWIIRRGHAAPLPAITADRSPAGIAEGGRMAFAVGCRGCHGPSGNGRLLEDIPGVVHLAAPALAPRIAAYSDGELARLIRFGVKRDGSAAFVMPIGGHQHIADDDLARIIGWLRTLKPSPADRSDTLSVGPMGRVGVLMGEVKPEVVVTASAPAKRPADAGGYLTDAVCGGCHALHEKQVAHDDGRPVPALAEIGPAYDLPAFTKLLRTGVGLQKRDLGLMGRVAKGDLSHLTDAEIAAIHAHLTRAAANAPAQ